MYKNIPNVSNDPSQEAPYKQVAFLFKNIAKFVENAEKARSNHQFEVFAQLYQRAFSLIYGLSSILNYEINKAVATTETHTAPTSDWDSYFISLVKSLTDLSIDFKQNRFDIIQKSLTDLAHMWEESGDLLKENMPFIQNKNAEGLTQLNLSIDL